MSEPPMLSAFDYSSLDENTRAFVQKKTDETHGLMKRTAEHIIQIGQNLLEVQQQLPEMKFSAWLRAEFDFSRRTAYNFMNVATKFAGSCATPERAKWHRVKLELGESLTGMLSLHASDMPLLKVTHMFSSTYIVTDGAKY